MNVFSFGEKLIRSGDLDPVYIVLHHADLDRERLADFLIAYWCFYHCGTATWVMAHGRSEKGTGGYWEALAKAAATAEHPRASERRHFRGENARKAVLGLRSRRLTCSELVEGLGTPEPGGGPPTLSTVVSRVRELEGFGPWIAFKAADMLERLGLAPVRFRPSDVLRMYDAPREGSELVARELGIRPGLPIYNALIGKLGTLKAPPRFERPLGIQEIETILCKYKSHSNGKYEVGKDIAELRHGLERYHFCAYASRLLIAGVKAGLWERSK